jgi:hypothetical protein
MWKLTLGYGIWNNIRHLMKFCLLLVHAVSNLCFLISTSQWWKMFWKTPFWKGLSWWGVHNTKGAMRIVEHQEDNQRKRWWPPQGMHFIHDIFQWGVCHTVALPITLKSILRQKKNYGNSNISTCKNIIFKKNPLKETKILQDIVTL